jgi:hypothetical protein
MVVAGVAKGAIVSITPLLDYNHYRTHYDRRLFIEQ